MKVFSLLITTIFFAGCSFKTTSIYRHYYDYYVRETYINSKTGKEVGVHIFIVDSVISKGERIYSSKRNYILQKENPEVSLISEKRKFIFCKCENDYHSLDEIDSLILTRFIRISDSLNWDKNNLIKNFNGYRISK